MPALAIVALALAGLALLGMTAPAAIHQPTPATWPQGTEPAATPSGQALRSADLPDLVPVRMSIGFETGDSCDWAHSRFGLRARVANRGSADAGAFVVDLNGRVQETVPGLAAGAEASLFFTPYNYPAANVLVVDINNDVVESDEQNNALAEQLPIPTAPATCTPTPSPVARAYLPLLLKGW